MVRLRQGGHGGATEARPWVAALRSEGYTTASPVLVKMRILIDEEDMSLC